MEEIMNEDEVVEMISDALKYPRGYIDVYSDEPDIDIDTFVEAQVLTMDKGFLLRINGEEFQVTVIKTHRRW